MPAAGDDSHNNQPGSEDVCAGCAQHPLDVSLVLTCNHRLCLDCAARALCQHGPNDHTAACPECGAVTDVDPSAAAHLREHLSSTSQPAVAKQQPPASEFAYPKQQPSARPAPAVADAHRANGVGSHLSPDLCGQCLKVPAEWDCFQCGEQFCSSCSAMIHTRGRMKDHHLTPLAAVPTQAPPGSATTLPSASIGYEDNVRTSDRAGGPASIPQVSPASVMTARCAKHPEEPASFFCMDHQSECICAECAVDAAHNGREVVNVKKAYQTLSKDIDQTLYHLKGREDEQMQTRRQAEAVKGDLDTIIGKGKRNVSETFRQLRDVIARKEAELLAGIDACETAASQTLTNKVQPAATHTTALQEAQAALRKIDARTEEVKALNSFASAKITVERLVDPRTGVDGASVGHLIDSLREELRTVLQQQASDVTQLASRVNDIRRSSVPTQVDPKGARQDWVQ